MDGGGTREVKTAPQWLKAQDRPADQVGFDGNEVYSFAQLSSRLTPPDCHLPPEGQVVTTAKRPRIWGWSRQGQEKGGPSQVTSTTGSVEYSFRISRTSGSPMAPKASPKKNQAQRAHVDL